MKKIKCARITPQQRHDLVNDLKSRIYVIMLNIEGLLDKNGKIYDIGIAALKETRYNLGIASLYIHALEQLGKLIMIRQCKLIGKYYDLKPIEKDFYDHDKKIDLALGNLPSECKDIFIMSNSSNTIQPSLETRLQFLHSDIDNKGNVVSTPIIDTDRLQKAVQRFKAEYAQF